jgi:hypothetical protein
MYGSMVLAVFGVFFLALQGGKLKTKSQNPCACVSPILVNDTMHDYSRAGCTRSVQYRRSLRLSEAQRTLRRYAG